MFDELTFTFGYNSVYKDKVKDEEWYKGKCATCKFYEKDKKLCHKYRMISEPEQKCKGYIKGEYK